MSAGQQLQQLLILVPACAVLCLQETSKTDRRTDGQTDRRTDRQTDKQTDRLTDPLLFGSRDSKS